jgi:ferredoxin
VEQKKTAWVLYYSNSGNTKNLAELAGETLKDYGWVVKSVSLMDFDPFEMKKPRLVLLGTPTHFWAVPAMAQKRIAKFPDLSGAAGFVFSTFGNVFPSAVPYVLARELEKRGAKVLGGAALVGPHNFMDGQDKRLGEVYSEFGKGQPDGTQLAEFAEAVKIVAEKAENEELSGFNIKRLKSPKPVLTFMDRFLPVELELKALAPVNFDVSKCQDCGLCVKNCDTKSITKGSGKVKIINQKTCKRCYTCARECPAGALTVDWAKNEKILRLAKKVVKSPGSRVLV